MDFQKLLLEIGQSLDAEEVRALAFLCKDISQRSLNSVELFSDLCSSLSDQDLLSPDRPQLLQELLLTIRRPRLTRHIPLTVQGPRRDLISPYRKLLYNLYEDITDEDLRSMKFLLNQKLPRRKLDENVKTLELFLEMEQMDLLGKTNVDLLQSIFESVCPVLNEKINCFKQKQVNSLAGMSNCVDPNQRDLNDNPQSFYGGGNVPGLQSLLQPSAQVSFLPPNASVDFPHGLHCHDYEGAQSQHVSDANVTNSNTVKGRRDALETSAESTDISKKPMINVNTEATNVEELESYYSMTGEKRGVCMIVNNDNFSDKRKREGTQIDQDCLERVFKWLGFEVEVHPDCTAVKMLSVTKQLSSRDHRNMDCVVCCFLSHGQEGSIFGVDGQTVSITKLKRLFNGAQCPSLVDKPKLFFIQACQGTNEQQMVSIQTDGPASCSIESDATKMEESIPSEADFLLGMATVPSYFSYRERSNGSWYIQALCKNLVQMVPRLVNSSLPVPLKIFTNSFIQQTHTLHFLEITQ
uniref:Caspase-8 n=1 Tax=Neogobius melanostomus TaxID=47308 RepID=A0A8C6TJM7_9GOBI